MGYDKYHFNETMTDSMLNTLEKSPTVDSIVSGTTHYHYQTPYYAGDWLVWHIPGTWSDGYYSYATTQHTRTEDDPKDSSFEDGDKHDYYYNFNAITGVNFLNHDSHWSSVELYIGDSTAATNLTFGYGDVTAGMSATLSNLNFTNGGIVQLGVVYDDEEEVVVSSTGLGNVVSPTTVYYATTDASLTNLSAAGDFDRLVTLNGGRSIVNKVTVKRNMRELAIAPAGGSYGVGNPKLTGSGTTVTSVMVSGRLNSVTVGNMAQLNMLTVGLQRSFTSADLSAFGYFSSSYVGSGGSWVLSSATYMTIESGGTASNIYLNNGGSVTVMGPEDRVSSTWNSATQQYDVTTSYASGAGGTLTNLQMAMSGGLQFGGLQDYETWNSPNNAYLNSSSYMSHFRVTAPQSAYVEFQSNTSGSNISIGQGGSMRISAGASVTNISMGALTTSTFHTKDGKQMTWVGDRGAKLVLDGGFASNVAVEGAPLTRDYYFAAHNHFSTLSSSIQRDYYDQHSSYLDSNVASASAAAGYNAYMSSRYTEALSDYGARYLGGEIIVQGGTLLNASRFAYLYANDKPEMTFSGGSVHMSARIGERVSSATGALSATVEIDGAAHVTSITVAGGRFVMGGNSGGVARWANQSNAQSNYALAEYIDLRTSGLEGDNHSAMVLFGGNNYSNTYPVAVMSNGSQVYGSWTYYAYECTDPGEIHYLTGDKGLIVKDLGWGGQDFTYTGSGAVTINGLGTVVLKGNHSRYTSDSYYGKGPYLGSAYNEYYFGVVKGVYDEENGKLQAATILNGDGGFDWKGTLVVGSGGIVQDIGAQAGLKTANTLTSDSWNPVIENEVSKQLVLVAGGSADNVTVTGRVTNYERTSSSLYRSNAALLVSSGATATNVHVLSGGMAMAEGGVINGAFVGDGGILYLSGWAGAHQVAKDEYGNELAGPQYLDETVLNAVRLDSGGQLAATLDWGFRGGHSPNVIANKGGGIMNGVTANGVAYVSGLDYAGAITLTKDQQALDVTVRGFKTITSRDAEGNPTAYTTTVASLNVSSGGIVKNATVGEEGAIYVSEGANVSGLSASGGRLVFENAGSGWGDYLPASAAVNGMAVLDGGILQVNSKFGLTASNLQIGESAGLEVTIAKDADEDYAKTELNGAWQTTWGGGTFQTNDGVLTGFGGQFGYEYRDIFYSSAYTSARLSMTFLNGAVLSGGDLRGYGFVAARNGGKIINTHIRGITANVGASGYASGLTATTESTGSAYDTNIYVYGSGALAENTVLSGGFLAVEGGGTVNGITMMAPEGYNGPAGDAKTIGPAEMEITAGGRANNAVASAGLITLYNGSYKEAGMSAATLSNADIHSAATLLVNEDGVVLDGTLNLGGTVVTTAERDEWIEVEVTDPDTGDVYTDWQRVTKNNAVANASTLTVNFDLTERNGSEEGAMIDNLANLEGAKLGTITVTADQAGGQYVLAQGAEDFTGTISVKVSDEKLGDFSVGTIWQYAEDTVFTLTNNANVGLCFTVQNTAAVVEDIIATVDGKELLKGQWTNKAVTIKTSVNQYSQSIWYKIKKAVVTRKAPADDGWTQLDNDTGITVSEYCSVDFMALNAKGQQSRVVTYTVNYDATAAEIGDLRSEAGDAELHDGDESQVSVLVTDDLDEAPTVELLSGADWTALEQGSDGRYAFTVTGNGEYTLRATDHAGNVTTQAVTVDFYTGGPAALPTVLSATPDTTAPTNKNVTVTAAFSGNAAKKEYRIGSGNWLAYTGPVVMENNGTVSFRAGNEKGYSGATEVVVNNIDRVPPEQPASEASTTAPTNQNVTVIAVFSDDSVKKEYSLDGQTWKAYGNGVTMQDNGTVFFRGIDAAGNVSPVESCVVANIDKIPPATPAGMEVTVFEDRARVVWDEVADDGLAPLAGYGIRYGNSADLSGDGEMVDGSMKQFTDLTPGDWYYQVRTCDSAGNASDWSELQSFKIDDSAVNKLNVLSGGSGSEVVTHDSEGNVVVLDTATGTTKSLGTLDRSQWDILGTGKETSGGVPELLVQNRETGAVYLTDNAAGTVSDASVQSGTLLGVVPAGTELAGVGNFNGSGHPGALLIEPEQQHGSSKETQLDCWTVSEDGQAESAPLGSIFTTWDGDKLNIPASLTDEAEINSRYYSFDVAGIGDFNGDGKDDVMIRNTMPGTVDGKKITGAGDIFVCLTGVAPQNGQKINAVYTGCAPDPWRIAGFGDLNGDNITDVILENTSDGEIASWLLNSSGQYASAAHIGTLTAGQVFAGVSDVDNDKVADVLFTDFDGSLHAWTVQNGAAKGQIALS